MKVLRILGGVLLVLALGIAAILAIARLHDGPFGMVAGGPLTSGDWVLEPNVDLRFTHDVPTIEFQLLEPARSRTTWIVEYEGRHGISFRKSPSCMRTGSGDEPARVHLSRLTP